MEKEEYQKELLIVTGILAACSIIYELLLSNTLAIITNNYVWWQSLTIGIYIGGLGLGSYIGDKKMDNYVSLFKAELALSFLGIASVAFVYLAHGSYRVVDYMNYISSDYYSSLYVQNNFYLKSMFFLVVEGFIFLVGYFSGHEIPLLIKVFSKRNENDGITNLILGISYFGTLLGTLLFVFFLYPKLDVLYTSLLIGSLNLAVCFYFLFKKWVQWTKKVVALLILNLVLLGCLLNQAEYIQQTYLKTIYLFHRLIDTSTMDIAQFYNEADEQKDVERRKSLYQYIDIFHLKGEDGNPDEMVVNLDTRFQFSFNTEASYHQSFAHLPIDLTSYMPKNVLVLGGGDGLLIRELLKHSDISSITQIELDQDMLEMSKNEKRFKNLNQGSLSNPRVKTIIGDAFIYLRNNKKKYDAVYIDFPYPNSYNLSRLYRIEFYTYVQRALKDEGFMILDAPMFPQQKMDYQKTARRAILTTVFTPRDKRHNSILLSTIYYSGFKKFTTFLVRKETFIVAKNNLRPFNYYFYKKEYFGKYSAIGEDEFIAIQDQEFPHELRREDVNSIFRPRLTRRIHY